MKARDVEGGERVSRTEANGCLWSGVDQAPNQSLPGALPSSLSGFSRACSDKTHVPLSRNRHLPALGEWPACFVCIVFASVSHDIQHPALGTLGLCGQYWE